MQYYLDFLTLLILFGVLLLLSYCFYKVKRIDTHVFELLFQVRKIQHTDLVDIFQQHQHLSILDHELSLTHPLPPTRGWAASPDFLLTIARHAHDAKPKRVVECSSGVSTLVLASCMRDNGQGHVYSLEHDEAYARMTEANLEREGLGQWATVLRAPLTDHEIGGKRFSWYEDKVLPEGSIDMVVIDGPPHLVGEMARYPAGERLFKRLSDGGIAFADDAHRPEELPTFEAWRREFPSFKETYRHCEKGCISFTKAS